MLNICKCSNFLKLNQFNYSKLFINLVVMVQALVHKKDSYLNIPTKQKKMGYVLVGCMYIKQVQDRSKAWYSPFQKGTE